MATVSTQTNTNYSTAILTSEITKMATKAAHTRAKNRRKVELAKWFNDLDIGYFTGVADLNHWSNDEFKIVIPFEKEPLTFHRANGEKISLVHGELTDLGSIPKFLQVFSSLDRCNYALAYMIHDRLHKARSAEIEAGKKEGLYTNQDASTILAETIKTLMFVGYLDHPKPDADPGAARMIYDAVNSWAGEHLFESIDPTIKQ